MNIAENTRVSALHVDAVAVRLRAMDIGGSVSLDRVQSEGSFLNDDSDVVRLALPVKIEKDEVAGGGREARIAPESPAPSILPQSRTVASKTQICLHLADTVPQTVSCRGLAVGDQIRFEEAGRNEVSAPRFSGRASPQALKKLYLIAPIVSALLVHACRCIALRNLQCPF